MKKALLIFAILTTMMASAQKFDDGMQRALTLWQQGKPTEASALLERIAVADPVSWLPNYYIALINTTQAFANPTDIEKLLFRAQAALDVELEKHPSNVELLVVQAMAHTAWIASDPMTYGMSYSARVMESYAKALAIDPQNPRAVIGKAEFDFPSAPFTGADIKPICRRIEHAIELFATFKPESKLHPKWGLERALELKKSCN